MYGTKIFNGVHGMEDIQKKTNTSTTGGISGMKIINTTERWNIYKGRRCFLRKNKYVTQ